MNNTVKKYWRLFWQFRKLQLMRMTEYRGDFFFWTFVSLMWTAFNIFFFKLLISVSSNIAGWSEYDLYAFMGIYTMFDSLFWGFFYHNMAEYRTTIYDGKLSTLLLKPINPIYMILVQRNSYNNVPRFFVGIFLLIWSLAKLGINPSLEQIVAFALLFITGSVFVYFAWFLTTTAAFWFDRLDNIIEIMHGLKNIAQYPASVYTGILSFLLTLIFPMLLVTTLPAETLIREDINWLNAGYFALYTAALVAASLWFFNFSIKKYSSVGN